MSTSIPVIGITLDAESSGAYSRYPWYALRENYAAAVSRAGGLPILLPHEPEQARAYLDRVDAIVVSGGAFDVDPALWGASSRHPTVTTKDRRTVFELALMRGALERDLPVLGICGGEQLLNVVLGGTLVQHIPDEIPNALAHEQPNPRHEPGHAVSIAPGTRLAAVLAESEIAVNSAHHQAVKATGPGVRVAATAPDGVVEAIEAEGRRFCLGVQWHPEFLLSAADERVFAALIEASR